MATPFQPSFFSRPLSPPPLKPTHLHLSTGSHVVLHRRRSCIIDIEFPKMKHWKAVIGYWDELLEERLEELEEDGNWKHTSSTLFIKDIHFSQYAYFTLFMIECHRDELGVGTFAGGRERGLSSSAAAGFVWSHLVDKLIAGGDDVIVLDNFFTGRKENVVHLFGNHTFELIRHDVVEPILLEVDQIQIYHFVCPAFASAL